MQPVNTRKIDVNTHTYKHMVMGQCGVSILFEAVDTPCCSPYYSVHIKQVVLWRKRNMMTRPWLTIQLILMLGFFIFTKIGSSTFFSHPHLVYSLCLFVALPWFLFYMPFSRSIKSLLFHRLSFLVKPASVFLTFLSLSSYKCSCLCSVHVCVFLGFYYFSYKSPSLAILFLSHL